MEKGNVIVVTPEAFEKFDRMLEANKLENNLKVQELLAKPSGFVSAPAKRLPQVGDSLLILHEVKRSGEGEVLGLKRSGRNDTADITAVYLDGTVRSGTSDAWEVTFNGFTKGGKPQWKTVNPWLEEKEKRAQEFAELNKH